MLDQMQQTATRQNELARELAAKSQELDNAVTKAQETTDNLYDLIVYLRAQATEGDGWINQMADAMDRKRNYVDSVWSDRDPNREVHGSWFGLAPDTEPELELLALSRCSEEQLRAAERETKVRKERNSLIAHAYENGGMGPTRIAEAVGIDRNHVGRILRAAGVSPKFRKNIRNQYSATPDAPAAA